MRNLYMLFDTAVLHVLKIKAVHNYITSVDTAA
jgi:hypothetical protein